MTPFANHRLTGLSATMFKRWHISLRLCGAPLVLAGLVARLAGSVGLTDESTIALVTLFVTTTVGKTTLVRLDRGALGAVGRLLCSHAYLLVVS